MHIASGSRPGSDSLRLAVAFNCVWNSALHWIGLDLLAFKDKLFITYSPFLARSKLDAVVSPSHSTAILAGTHLTLTKVWWYQATNYSLREVQHSVDLSFTKSTSVRYVVTATLSVFACYSPCSVIKLYAMPLASFRSLKHLASSWILVSYYPITQLFTLTRLPLANRMSSDTPTEPSVWFAGSVCERAT